MKLLKKISLVTAIILSFAILGCTNSSDGSSNSNDNGTTSPTSSSSPETPATPETPEEPETPAEPGNPSGETPTTPEGTDPETSGDNPENPEEPENLDEPTYKWLSIRNESITKQDEATVYRDYNGSTEYNYSYYTDSRDYKQTGISTYNDELISGRGTEWENSSITNETSKSITTCVKEGTGYTSTTDRYIQNGNEWELDTRQTTIRCETTEGYTLTINSYSKNGSELELSSTAVNSYELLSKDNDVEIYKMTMSASSPFYYIYEYKNDIIIKLTIYVNDKKSSEIIYQQPDNQIIKDRIPNFTLSTTKSFDTDGNCVSESCQTLEDVILNESQNTLTIKTGSSTNSESNYSYTITTYKKMQIPFVGE